MAARLSLQERLFLFCLASGTDWQRAGVNVGAATQLVVRNLVERDPSPARFRLTSLGAKVFAALVRYGAGGVSLKLPADWLRSVRELRRFGLRPKNIRASWK